MLKTSLSLVIAALLLPVSLSAATFSEQCAELSSCAKFVGELLGQRYIFDADLKGKVLSTPNLELTKDNAEVIFTNALYLEGFSRVATGVPSTFQIVRQRDARDMPINVVSADSAKAPELPKTWDMMTLKYKAKHADAVEMIARMSRSFMPANARIVPSDLSSEILVTDSAPNLKKLYDLIRDMDQKPTAEMKKRLEEDKLRARQQQGLQLPKKPTT